MKRKTFLTTLFLFLLVMNLGITLIAIHSYHETVEQARRRSAAEHYFIASGLLADMTALDNRDADYEQGMLQLVLPYGYLVGNQNSGIALYHAANCIYSNIREENLTNLYSPPENGDRQIVLTGRGADSAMLVAGRFPDPYSKYVLIYRCTIADSIHGWQSMKNTMFGVGMVLSGIMAVCLLLLLGKLFQPLADISKISCRIAGGEYSTRLTVRGKDELAEMAESFNHMADEVERQIDELITTAQNKQLFIDNFAHELKTPLTAIYGYAEYLQKASLLEDDRNFAIACILSESSRIQTMAYQMMELANLRSNQIHIDCISPSELLFHVKQVMLPKALKKNIDLLIFNELNTLCGDENLLESLFINLIDNAVKASEVGSQVIIKAFKDLDVPVITIEDHGKGMPQEALPHVTEPYYRVEKHRHRDDGGAGLGLAICEQIVARHQAKLRFISAPGKGTIAKIQFYNSITC